LPGRSRAERSGEEQSRRDRLDSLRYKGRKMNKYLWIMIIILLLLGGEYFWVRSVTLKEGKALGYYQCIQDHPAQNTATNVTPHHGTTETTVHGTVPGTITTLPAVPADTTSKPVIIAQMDSLNVVERATVYTKVGYNIRANQFDFYQRVIVDTSGYTIYKEKLVPYPVKETIRKPDWWVSGATFVIGAMSILLIKN
jgi:hypothetical protein